MPGDLFVIDAPATTPIGRAAFAAVRPVLSWMLDARALARLYGSLPDDTGARFEDRVLRALDVEAHCLAASLARVPRRGPLVVAANHPHGAVDGLLLASVLARVRPDVRLLANRLLARIPELHASCFFVDPFEGPEAAARSRAGLRDAHLWLRRGGAVVIFPAGAVAPEQDAVGTPVDAEWHATVGRLALQTGAHLLPARIEGANSRLFYAAGRLHPMLRTALLSREFLRTRGRRFEVRIGAPLTVSSETSSPADAAGVTAQVRAAVDQLAAGPPHPPLGAAAEIAAEVSHLPEDACLLRSGAYRVFCAACSDIPATLLEIGRLRAITYRAAGEGTGGTLDLDRFDDRYLHLFAWDSEARRVIGAYRLGRTDTIVGAQGVEGLYTRTLFRYDPAFIARLPPALELGRSFVRPEYQRNHSALLLLWRGIGRFIARHPEYRVLFGPVSISARYADSSHELLRAFLEQRRVEAPLGRLVDPVNPPHPPVAAQALLPRSIEEADRRIAAIEADGKGMPVLLRHYLKLGARLIGFNVDHEFGDVLDALMMVDLAAVDRSMLSRYMGRDDASALLSRYAPAHPASSAA